jgi:SnoaL-like domain
MSSIPIEITNFLTAMQAGRVGGEAMAALFSPNAIYVEPFSGEVQRHEGRDAIMIAMSRGWDEPLPNMRIAIEKADTKGDVIKIQWTCFSPALAGGKGKGTNIYRMKDGLIVELETILDFGVAS